MKWFKDLLNKYPIIGALLVLAGIGFFIWWLSQPIEIIYDSDAPSYWIDDDPEGGYFPRH